MWRYLVTYSLPDEPPINPRSTLAASIWSLPPSPCASSLPSLNAVLDSGFLLPSCSPFDSICDVTWFLGGGLGVFVSRTWLGFEGDTAWDASDPSFVSFSAAFFFFFSLFSFCWGFSAADSGFCFLFFGLFSLTPPFQPYQVQWFNIWVRLLLIW